MTIYRVLIGTKEYKVDLNHQSASVNGEEMDVNLFSLNDNGLFMLKRGREAMEVHIHTNQKGTVGIRIGRKIVEAKVERFNRRFQKRISQSSDADLLAPMPGVVVEVFVKPGQLVEEGESLVVMESMKMKMQMRAPASGEVGKIKVQPGDEVEKGDLMVAIKPISLEE